MNTIKGLVFCFADILKFHSTGTLLYNQNQHFAPDKGIHVVDFGFQVLNFSLYQWSLDAGPQSLVGFRILSAIFRIPKPRIPDYS